MTKNIHSVERVVRIVVGLLLLSQVFIGVQSPWFALGLVPLLTGIMGWCPPYAMFGINTCKLGESKKQ
jgi:hypothetical protein